jgi:hypothetical protein
VNQPYEPQPIDALIWVDADDRIRRISYQRGMSYPPSRAGPSSEPAPIWAILELWDFGIDVDEAFPF